MHPAIWVGAGLVALFGGARVVDETGDTLGQAAQLAKWGAVAGGVYVSFRALQAAKVLK